MTGDSIIAVLMAALVASASSAQGSFTLPDLKEELTNPDCPNAPVRPERIKGMTAIELATELYKQEGYRNVVEAGECTCDLRFPDWDTVSAAMETEFAGISRFRFLEIIPDIRRATKAYRREGRPICQAVGLW